MTPIVRRRWCALAALLFLPAGCGGGHAQVAAPAPHRRAPVADRVPAGAVAIVGAVPVTAASYGHWLAVLYGEQATGGSKGGRALSGPPAYAGCVAMRRAHGVRGSESAVRAQCALGHQAAVKGAVSFLVRAQWLLQESRVEGIKEAVLNRLVTQRTAGARAHGDMTIADVALQARLDIITEALRSRHSETTSVTHAQVAGYYASHRSQYLEPAVRDTLMVVTHGRTAALAARAELARGVSWRAVAKRWSVDSSALIGGAFAVVEGEQSPVLVRAVFTAKRGRIVGPVKAPPDAGPPTPDYYLFEVIGGHAGSPQTLSQVAADIRQTLTQGLQQRSWATFTSAYERRWRARTLCAPGYVVPECRNDVVPTNGHKR